ncbi:phosphatidylglycerophosphatase A [bacterium]|nr:phosphatidylglycerophosphatase A [bacterium]
MTPALPFRHPATLIGTVLGLGLLGKGQGTIASLAALIPGMAMLLLGHEIAGPLGGAIVLLAASAKATASGTWASHIYLNAKKRIGQGEDTDPSEIVIDEVAGQWLLLAFVPPTVLGMVTAFILFRLFDITKPGPVGWADRHIKGAWGVMFDDIVAAIMGIVTLALLQFIWLAWHGHQLFTGGIIGYVG